MNWKCKAQMHSLLSQVPLGERVNYLLQRHVTRSLPVDDREFACRAAKAKTHLDLIRRCGGPSPETATFYEFGAGWDMIVPLAFWALGVNRQLLIDIRPLLRIELIDDTILRFQRLLPDLPLVRVPETPLGSSGDPLAALRERYGIEYQAPLDARETGWEAWGIDIITSSNTLEHIPRADLPAILRECHRLLHDDGLMSFRVDYQDHYAMADRSISIYNFLRYSEEEWARYSPPLHYQNRMRHRDYLELYESAGFEVAAEELWTPTELQVAALREVPLAEPFRFYSIEELAIPGGTVVLRKRRSRA